MLQTSHFSFKIRQNHHKCFTCITIKFTSEIFKTQILFPILLFKHTLKQYSRTQQMSSRSTSQEQKIKMVLEVGFQYKCEKDGLLCFRKRKKVYVEKLTVIRINRNRYASKFRMITLQCGVQLGEKPTSPSSYPIYHCYSGCCLSRLQPYQRPSHTDCI